MKLRTLRLKKNFNVLIKKSVYKLVVVVVVVVGVIDFVDNDRNKEIKENN